MASILIPLPPSIDPTPAQRAANELRRILRNSAEALVATHQNAYQLIWGNSQASPAEVLRELGTDAAEIFQRGGDVVDFLRGVHTKRPIADIPSEEYAIPVPVEIHPDGRVTLISAES